MTKRMSEHEIDLLIIGAGPFGLAVAAQASQLGIEHIIAGFLVSLRYPLGSAPSAEEMPATESANRTGETS